MKPSRVNKTALFLVGALLLACFAFYLYGRSSGKKGIEGTVVKQDLQQRVTIAGSVASRRRTLVTGPYNGYVRQLFVKVGDAVKPGSPLVSVAQSLQSTEPVFPLRAPYAGTVMHIQKHEGEYVKENDPQEYILRIDDLSSLYLDASAPEADRVKLKGGQDVVIKVSAVPTRTYKGRISELTLAPQIEQNNGRYNSKGSDYPVRIEITDADAQLGPGMSAVVDIITSKQSGLLTLRHEFIYRQETESFVVLADGQKQKVETGAQNDELMEIKSGLQEGAKVRQVDFTSLPVTE
jgi:multidrug efflux pump subunit AcrA (membrane-fusion protein)